MWKRRERERARERERNKGRECKKIEGTKRARTEQLKRGSELGITISH